MDPDENNNFQNDREVEKMGQALGAAASKTAKKAADNVKGGIKAAWRSIPISIRVKIIIAILIVLIIAVGLFYFLQLFGDNNVSGTAMKQVMDESVEIADNNGDYYFKIHKDVIEKYKDFLNRAYEDGGYEVSIDRTFDNIDEAGSQVKSSAKGDKEATDETFNDDTIEGWFKTDNKSDIEAYLVKMIRTEIGSSYPKLSNYEGQEIGLLGNSKSKELGNKMDGSDYVAQGIIKIMRTKMNVTADGATVVGPTGNYSAKANSKATSHRSSVGANYYEILPENINADTKMVVYLPGAGEFNNQAQATSRFSERRRI